MTSINIADAKAFLGSVPPLYFALAVLVLFSFTRPGQFYAKAISCVLAVGFCGLFGVLCGLVLTPLGKRTAVNWLTARLFYYLGRGITGIDVVVEGLENLDENKSAVYLQNHQASMDLLPLGAVFPKNCGILAKAELKYYPFLGQFMQLGQTVFINRSKHGDAIKAMGQAAEDMKKKKMSLWLFPEGTRARLPTADLLPFKKGGFHLAVQAQVPIIPIVVANYTNLYNSRKNIFTPGVIRIRILPPIETKGRTSSHEDIESLLETTRNAMLVALKEISPIVDDHKENGSTNGVLKKIE